MLKQRDANFAIVVIGAIGDAVRRRRMVVNGSRPLLGDDMTATRDGTCRADLRQAGAVKRNQAEGGGHLYLREGSRLQERERDKTRANATQASLRERTFKRGRQIADF